MKVSTTTTERDRDRERKRAVLTLKHSPFANIMKIRLINYHPSVYTEP